jgi:hypothetical protein
VLAGRDIVIDPEQAVPPLWGPHLETPTSTAR